MATQFNPRYVNLDPYESAQLSRRANMVSPLDALLQGAQQGIQLGQLPQQLQDQALARQLQNAINTQKLQDLQNPEGALARELQKLAIREAVTNPNSGIIQSPIPGATIATPRAINQTAEELAQSMSITPDQALPSAAPGLPITPIGTGNVQTGLSIDQNVPLEAETRSLNNKIALLNARPELFRTLQTDQGLFGVGNRSNETVPLLSPTGEQLTAPAKASGKGSSGFRPLTEGQKTSLLLRIGKAGVNPDEFTKEDGTYDFDKMAIAAGAAERASAEESRKAKLDAIPAELRSKAAGYVAVQKDLEDLKADVLDLQKNGKIPSSVDNAIAAATAKTPGGFFGSLYQAGLKSLQSADSKEFEGTKARVSTSLTNMISGAAVPENERQYLTPFLPVVGESFESLVGKLAGLEQYLNNRITAFSAGASPQPTTPAPTAQPVSSPKIISIKRVK